jgi:DNA-directed RNA polymerase I, II, and III subunit RPABC2
MDLKEEDFENLSETMSESSDEKPAVVSDESDIDIESDEEDENDEEYENDDENENENGPFKQEITGSDEDEDEDEDEEDEETFDKIDEDLKTKIIQNHHPELKTLNYEEIDTLCTLVKDKKGIIIDPLHKTLPILSRYEKARALGERAEQINSGAQPFIEVESSMIDGYLIAMKELEQKKIPFIIQRPLPNGGSEYWRLSDLENL